jgi:hypothetical protein
MLTDNSLKKTLPHTARPTIPAPASGLSAQALRPTFDGWGPRL